MAVKSNSRTFLYFLVGIVVLIGGIVGAIAIANQVGNPFKIISVEKFEEMKSDNVLKEHRVVYYYYSDTCSACTMFKPKLQSVAKSNDITIYAIDSSTVGDSTVIADLEIEQTPTLFVMKDGIILKRLTGNASSDDIIEFFESVKVIE